VELTIAGISPSTESLSGNKTTRVTRWKHTHSLTLLINNLIMQSCVIIHWYVDRAKFENVGSELFSWNYAKRPSDHKMTLPRTSDPKIKFINRSILLDLEKEFSVECRM
jgi:hypothetical protein